MQIFNQLKAYLFFCLLIVIFYGSTLFNGFVHDDIWQVQDNKYVKSISNIPAIFTSCIAEDIIGGCKNKGFYYRPLQSILYTLDYQISSRAWFFHLMNVSYLLIAAVLVFQLFKTINPTRGVGFIVVGTIIFLIHPINSEVANWVSATPELLTTIFILAAILLYDRFTRRKKNLWLVLSALAYLLALLAKETALFLVLLLPLYEYLFRKVPKGVAWFKRYSFIAWHMGAVGIYLVLREEALGRVVYKYEGYYSMDTYTQVINGLSLLPQYLFKLVYPFPLSFQPQILPVSAFNMMSGVGVLAILATAAAAFFAWKKRKKMIIFGLGITVLPILPVLLFVNKLGENLFSERYLFLSSIGFSLIIISFDYQYHIRSYMVLIKRVMVAGFICIMAVSWWIVFNRNKDWKDNVTSYQSMLRVNPDHTKARFQLGEYYATIGEFQKAAEELKTVLSLDPNYPEAQRSLSLITQRYNSKIGLSFYQPEGFRLEENEGWVDVTGLQNKLSVRISLEKVNGSRDEYLIGQTEKFGVLTKEGLGQIPNFEQTVVRFWQDSGINKLQFFLFKDGRVVKILVYPADSPLTDKFNLLLGSIRLNAN